MTTASKALAGLRVESPQVFRNMAIYPLVGDDELEPSYMLLDEALEKKLAEITEIGVVGTVPTLAFENKSPQPILLVDGDELRGAKQNRILNLTIFVGPGVKIEIPVSCIESGRWAYAGSVAMAAGSDFAGGAAYASLRAENLRNVSNSLHATDEPSGNQSAVWQNIGQKFHSTNTASYTSSMSDIYEQRSTSVAAYEEKFTSVQKQRGAVVCLDGKPVGLEVFDSPIAFAKYLKKLVRSYALDAIETVKDDVPASSLDDVVAFLGAVREAPEEQFSTVGEGSAMRWSSNDVAGGARVVGEKAVHLASFRA